MPDPRPKEDIENDKRQLMKRKRQNHPDLSDQDYKEKMARLNEELDAAMEEEERGE